MVPESIPAPADFNTVVSGITALGRDWHTENLLSNARRNRSCRQKTIKDLLPPTESRAIVVSAGPSLRRFDAIRKIKESDFDGAVICVDGSLVHCLKSGLIPDYVLTLDPHPTRIVRWFGDPDFEQNAANDDYFLRQDLDVEFRTDAIADNQKNIQLVNAHASGSKLIICSSAPENVVNRAREAGFDMYWWNPLVDDPRGAESLTRRIYDLFRAPCMNTGGTVGTAAWVFATTILNIPSVAVVGMDLGYPASTPYELTQTYYELVEHLGGDDNIKAYFPEFTFPLTGEAYYTDPTYSWYRRNFLELLAKTPGKTYNCSEAGTLIGDKVDCVRLEAFLKKE